MLSQAVQDSAIWLQGAIWRSLLSLCSFWSLGILYVNRVLLFFEYGAWPASDFYHKVVLIGDGLACGWGSFIQMGFPAGAARKLNMEYGKEASIKSRWIFFERGFIGSTTQDWLPAGPRWKRVFESRSCRDASIVVVMMGVQDLLQGKEDIDRVVQEKGEKAQLVTNLQRICTELRQMGFVVCLCDLPVPVKPASTEQSKAFAVVNKQIAQLAASWEGGALPLVKMSNPRVSKADYRAWDGVHLSGRGYRALGSSILEAIKNLMVQHEWTIYQQYLKGEKVRRIGWSRWFGRDGGSKIKEE